MDETKKITRRKFLKIFGAGAMGASTILSGCSSADSQNNTGSSDDIPSDKMTYREDNHGQKVSLLGYGCMRLPTTNKESGREDDKHDIDQEEVNRLVDYAIAHGVNLFDTSPAYCQGRSEHAMGVALSRHKRSEYLVSTKLSNFGVYTREASLQMYHDSFKELQVDYLDYYLLHAIGGGEDAMQLLKDRYLDNGMLDFLLNERKEGRIKNLGFSYHGDIRIFDYMLSRHDEIHWDFVLIQLNYVDWKHAKQINPRNTNAEYLYGELEKRNLPAFVMEPLLGGRLANLNDKTTALLKSKEPNNSIASWSFRFCGTQPKVLSVLSGMTYMEHLQDNVKTYSPLKPLNQDELNILEDVAQVIADFPTVPCTSCQYCMPCPFGINIPGIFSHFNKCVNEGNIQENPANAEYQKARQAFLVGYDRAIPRLRQADHCISCGRCKPACPQLIDIPKEMSRINSFVELLKRSDAELGPTVLLAAMLRKLDEGQFSCIVHKEGVTRTFSQRGVTDLYELYQNEKEFLQGSLVADKIVGKGAATLMVLGGVKAVRTATISKGGLQILQEHNIPVTYDDVTGHVINRKGDDWCPLDKRLKDASDTDSCKKIIDQFIQDLKAGKI